MLTGCFVESMTMVQSGIGASQGRVFQSAISPAISFSVKETTGMFPIEHIIKKLNIKPNQKVLDIGSGWGSLAIDIAKKTSAQVVGITLSENQLEYSKKKVKELNLGNQVDFKLIDYRQINEKFDRIVSVGMFEHVGRKYYQKFFNQVAKLLN